MHVRSRADLLCCTCGWNGYAESTSADPAVAVGTSPSSGPLLALSVSARKNHPVHIMQPTVKSQGCSAQCTTVPCRVRTCKLGAVSTPVDVAHDACVYVVKQPPEQYQHINATARLLVHSAKYTIWVSPSCPINLKIELSSDIHTKKNPWRKWVLNNE